MKNRPYSTSLMLLTSANIKIKFDYTMKKIEKAEYIIPNTKVLMLNIESQLLAGSDLNGNTGAGVAAWDDQEAITSTLSLDD